MDNNTLKEELLNLEEKSLSKRIAEATNDNYEPLLQDIAEIEREGEREILIGNLSKKLGISRSAIKKDIKRITRAEREESETTNKNFKANFPGLVDIVEDNGVVSYLIKGKDSLEIRLNYENDGTYYFPPDKKNLPFEIPKAEKVIIYYSTDDDRKLFEDILTYLKRFSYLNVRQWLIAVCLVLLSYIQDHSDIHYIPELLFYAVPERGKSRTGKAMSLISYRGIHTVELREANIFRYSHDLKATIFFDVMNLWKKAERNQCEDILLGRHEKNQKVARVLYPEKGAFRDMAYYDIYGSTIIATNEPVHKILDTRCLPIIMPNMPGNYENPTPEKAQDLKERLTAFRARLLDKPLPEVEPLEDLNGRLWDIAKPVLQVCKLVCPDKFNELKLELYDIAGERLEDKKASIEGQIIKKLHELSPEDLPEWTVKTSDLLEELNGDRPENHELKSQYLGRKLKAMGLHTRKVQGYSEILLKHADFKPLLFQYGIENNYPLPLGETLPNSTSFQNACFQRENLGRELVESEGNSTETLPENIEEKQGILSLVESGRELTGGKEEEKNDELIDDSDITNLKSQGVSEPIYTADEIRKLKGMDKDTLNVIHRVKETFKDSKIEQITPNIEIERD